MKRNLLTEKYDHPIVLALGFFDCVHIGHKAIINEAKRLAAKIGAESAVLTFANDPGWKIGKEKQIYTFLEREALFENLKVDVMLYSFFNNEFADTSATDFLDLLTSNFNIKAIVTGRDYTFGKDALGDTNSLKEYADSKDIRLKLMPFEKLNSQKISTRTVKKFIKEGNITMVNTCLSEPYFMRGTIIHARHRGSIIGYPTANLSVHEDSLKLGSGLYATKMIVDGKSYIGGTNVGPKPTFGETDYSVETHLLDFNKDIYGKEVKLVFYKKLREVEKFNSIPAFQRQLAKDYQTVREFFGNEK